MGGATPEAAGTGGAEAPAASKPAAAASALHGDVLAALVAGVVEALAGIAYARQGIDLVPLLLVHLAVLAGLVAFLLRHSGGSRDVTLSALTLIATAAVGPLGAAAALVLGFQRYRKRERPEALQAWYERIARSIDVDGPARLSEQVAVGRALSTGAPPPPSFEAVMRTGTLADRQQALGYIARSFHADYLPALAVALASPEPVVRVQAAAVAAKIKAPLTAELTRLTGEAAAMLASAAASAGAALELRRRIEAVCGSALVDEADRRRCLALCERLGEAALMRLGYGGPCIAEDGGAITRLADLHSERTAAGNAGLAGDSAPAAPPQLGRQEREAGEALLIRCGRFAELRALKAQSQATDRPGEMEHSI